jgi:MFS family permease
MYLNKEYTGNGMFVVILSCFMVACTQAGITMYSPSMPYLVGVFHVGYSYIVYTLTAYLLGYAIATLFLGGASDQIGRKKSYLIAITIFMVTSLSLAVINSIAGFIVLRFLQGLGGGGCAIIGRASVRDVCEGKKLVKAMSYISISFIVSMGVFQYLGGLVQAYSNYKIDFIFMFCFGLIGLISVIFGFKGKRKINRLSQFAELTNKFLSILNGNNVFISSVVWQLDIFCKTYLNQSYGSTLWCLHVSTRLKRIAAACAPTTLSANSHPFRPITNGLIARSLQLFELSSLPSFKCTTSLVHWFKV